jgi:hypothetical protein
VRPDTFTITTFWLDWLLMPLMLAGAWFTARWARADSRMASDSKLRTRSTLPSWLFSAPLFAGAAGWTIAGFGALIKEDYWEMRIIFAAFLLWTACCLVGAVLLFLGALLKDRRLGTAGVLNLLGLVLVSILMVLPGLIDPSSPKNVTLIGHVWFTTLAVATGLLSGGLLLNFPYRFPRFPLGLSGLFFIGWGLSEISFCQSSFPWMVRIWRLGLGPEYLQGFPVSAGWKIPGAIKLVLGIGVVVVFVIASRRQRARGHFRKTPLTPR